jgi:hypothetical protein
MTQQFSLIGREGDLRRKNALEMVAWGAMGRRMNRTVLCAGDPRSDDKASRLKLQALKKIKQMERNETHAKANCNYSNHPGVEEWHSGL